MVRTLRYVESIHIYCLREDVLSKRKKTETSRAKEVLTWIQSRVRRE